MSLYPSADQPPFGDVPLDAGLSCAAVTGGGMRHSAGQPLAALLARVRDGDEVIDLLREAAALSLRDRCTLVEQALTRPHLTDADLLALFRSGPRAERITHGVITHPAATAVVWRAVAEDAPRPMAMVLLARHLPARRDHATRAALRASGHPVVLRYLLRDDTGPALEQLWADLVATGSGEAARALIEPAAQPAIRALSDAAIARLEHHADLVVRMRARMVLRDRRRVVLEQVAAGQQVMQVRGRELAADGSRRAPRDGRRTRATTARDTGAGGPRPRHGDTATRGRSPR